MKKCIAIVLVLLMGLSLVACGAATPPAKTQEQTKTLSVQAPTAGTCGEDARWSFDEATGALTITGSGEMENYVSEYDEAADDGHSTAPWAQLDVTSVTIDGVSTIGESAFSSCDDLTTVTMGDSVTTIGEWAFSGCTALADVTFGNSVEVISHCAFNCCSALTEITIPDSVNRIDRDAFTSNYSLTHIYADNAFYKDVDGVLFTGDMTTMVKYPENKAQASYAVPDGVTTICDGAFSNAIDLAEIIIPDSVTAIGEWAFFQCFDLVDVRADSESYVDVDGVLFTKDMTTLVTYPGSKAQTSYTVPDGVTAIRNNAFRGAFTLTEVIFPDSLTSIGEAAFLDGVGLTEITIPSGATNIGFCAFSGCENLTDVYYGGTEAQWNAIEVDAENESLLNANIHFNS